MCLHDEHVDDVSLHTYIHGYRRFSHSTNHVGAVTPARPNKNLICSGSISTSIYFQGDVQYKYSPCESCSNAGG